MQPAALADPWLLILTSLADGPKRGYAIMTDVAGFSGVRMEPGTLYGALSRLEHRGWVRPLATAERRRPHEITAAGQEILAPGLSCDQMGGPHPRHRCRGTLGTSPAPPA